MTIVSILNHFGLISEFMKRPGVHFLASRYIKTEMATGENGLFKYALSFTNSKHRNRC